MNYYHLPLATESGLRLKALFDQGAECEKAAEALVAKQGAVSWLSPEEAEWGGVAAFEFPLTTLLSAHQWETFSTADGAMYSVPRIDMKQEPIEKEQAEAMRSQTSKIVSTQEITFGQIRQLYRRQEAAEMVGLTLTTPDPRTLMEQAGMERTQISMIIYGAPIESVVPDMPSDLRFRVHAALDEDNAITELMADKRFLMVATISGPRKAKALFKQMQALPTIPSGSTNTVLQIEGNHRPGVVYSESAQCFYIQTSSTCVIDGIEPSTEKVYQQACKDAVVVETKGHNQALS